MTSKPVLGIQKKIYINLKKQFIYTIKCTNYVGKRYSLS